MCVCGRRARIRRQLHTHVDAATAVTDGDNGFRQITTASHIDWPQQARLVEFLGTPDALAIACRTPDPTHE